MSTNPKLDVLPTFTVSAVSRGSGTTRVDGSFSQLDGISVGSRGWLFVSETESSIGDILTVDGGRAGLDVPNWSMTHHVHAGAVLPWLNEYWQAGDLAFLLDETKQWQRVPYRPTDAVVFAKRILKCNRCDRRYALTTGRTCPSCSGTLSETEIFGNHEACFPLDADSRLLETRAGFWDHDHCLICDLAVGRKAAWGYRESSFAGGPNSVGIWRCEGCFERHLSRGDFSFLVRPSADV